MEWLKTCCLDKLVLHLTVPDDAAASLVPVVEVGSSVNFSGYWTTFSYSYATLWPPATSPW
jgi:hypothetical protein